MWRPARATERETERYRDEATRPALDLAAPAQVRTATFALG
jgi:hypothetical protein